MFFFSVSNLHVVTQHGVCLRVSSFSFPVEVGQTRTWEGVARDSIFVFLRLWNVESIVMM